MNPIARYLLTTLLLWGALAPPASAGDGALAVTSEPREAEVWLDGKLRAKKTPVVLQRLTPGDHTLELRKPGYQSVTREVFVPEDGVISEKVRLAADGAAGQGGGKLRAVSGDYGYLRVTTDPPGMQVRIDGRDGGLSPVKRLKLNVGQYTVEVSDPKGLYAP